MLDHLPIAAMYDPSIRTRADAQEADAARAMAAASPEAGGPACTVHGRDALAPDLEPSREAGKEGQDG